MSVLSAFLFFHSYGSTINFKFHPPRFLYFRQHRCYIIIAFNLQRKMGIFSRLTGKEHLYIIPSCQFIHNVLQRSLRKIAYSLNPTHHLSRINITNDKFSVSRNHLLIWRQDIMTLPIRYIYTPLHQSCRDCLHLRVGLYIKKRPQHFNGYSFRFHNKRLSFIFRH